MLHVVSVVTSKPISILYWKQVSYGEKVYFSQIIAVI